MRIRYTQAMYITSRFLIKMSVLRAGCEEKRKREREKKGIMF